jgi:hypothetical protein
VKGKARRTVCFLWMARDESKTKTTRQKYFKSIKHFGNEMLIRFIEMDLKMIAKETTKLGRTLNVDIRKEKTCWRLCCCEGFNKRAMLDIQIFR